MAIPNVDVDSMLFLGGETNSLTKGSSIKVLENRAKVMVSIMVPMTEAGEHAYQACRW